MLDVDRPLRAGRRGRRPGAGPVLTTVSRPCAPPLVEAEPVGPEQRLLPVGADPPADVARPGPSPSRAARTGGPTGSAAGSVGTASSAVRRRASRSSHRSPLRAHEVATLPDRPARPSTPGVVGDESGRRRRRPGRTRPAAGDRGDERRGPGRDRVVRLDRGPRPPRPIRRRSAGSSASAATAVDPLVGRRRRGSPSTPGSIISGWTPTGLATRQAGRLVLEDLQAALAPAPEVVGHPADPDVARRQLGGLGRLAPGDRDDRQRVEVGEPVADHPEPDPGDLAAEPLPERAAAAPAPAACSTSRSRPGRARARSRSGAGAAGSGPGRCRSGSPGPAPAWPRRGGRSRPGSRCRR